jgi:hypothetical protein
MAKDPAILWYWNDWNSGTTLMTRHLKGCYIDLLHAQFNHGRLSLEDIKICLGADFGSWPALQKKFKQDDNGLFFNERLECEKEKRKAHSEKQKENIRKRWDKSGKYIGNTTVYTTPIPLENENRNENEIKNEIKKGGAGGKQISEHEIGKTVEFCTITLHRNYTQERILELWSAFVIQSEGESYNIFATG